MPENLRTFKPKQALQLRLPVYNSSMLLRCLSLLLALLLLLPCPADEEKDAPEKPDWVVDEGGDVELVGDDDDAAADDESDTPASQSSPKAEELPKLPADHVFENASSAFDYLAQLARRCPKHVTVRVKGVTPDKLIQRASQVIHSSCPGSWCCAWGYEGGNPGQGLKIDISYSDFGLIQAVHEGRIGIKRLSKVRRKTYEKALSIIEDVKKEHDSELDIAMALHDWLVLNCKYRKSRHKGGPVVSMLISGYGVCECYARSYHLLCTLAGLECRYICGKAGGGSHAWNLLRIDGEWVHVDVTWDDPLPDCEGRVRYLYFGMDDQAMGVDHKWNRKENPACKTKKYWEPLKEIPQFDTVDQLAAAAIDEAEGWEESAKQSLEGYVKELAEKPKRAKALVRAAARKHKRKLDFSLRKDKKFTGVITIIVK